MDDGAADGAFDDALPVRSTLRSARPRRSADSGSFPPLTAPITVRARRFSNPGGAPPDRPEEGHRAAFPSLASFPHRLAAPAFGAILSGLLTYCLHQCAAPGAAQARLVRARTTYAEGVVAEPIRFDVELPDAAQVAPVTRAAPPALPAAAVPITERPAAGLTRRVAERDTVESSELPVVRPNELRYARDQPSRVFKATSRTKKNGTRAPGSGRRRPRSRGRD